MATTITPASAFYALLEDIPPGEWVAISQRQVRVLAHGLDAQVVVDQASEKGEPHPLIMRVPKLEMPLFL
jgi:hypothetical protein